VNPRKDEVCNFKDDDCDGSVDECDTVVYDAQGNRRTVGTGSCVYFPSPGCQMTVDQDGDGFYLFNSGSQEASTSALPGTCYEAGTFSMSEGTESKVVDYCYTNYPTDSSEQTCNACLDSCISDPNCACYGDTQYDDGYSFTYRYCDRTKLTTICPSCQETRLNCAYAKLPVCTDEVRTENCNDGEDNDGNGISDCADSDCKDASVCRNDCNDQNAIVYPGADEICNGMDDDCDGIMLDNEHDSDGDGISACFDRNDDEGDPAYPLSPDGAYYSIANANLLGWSVGQ